MAVTIQEYGRVRGFETLRDTVLNCWQDLRLQPQIALKLVMELDRHALFAEVSELKTKDKKQSKQWDYFRDYLEGKVDVFVDPENEQPLVPIESLVKPPVEEDEDGEDD